mmetsp:Transcript_28853/g.61906  ORF Transcript_28853/g.61906 Transcript_28853/m.61906 type:complete len:139 (+) Transcript_28853:937-1353(+)
MLCFPKISFAPNRSSSNINSIHGKSVSHPFPPSMSFILAIDALRAAIATVLVARMDSGPLAGLPASPGKPFSCHEGFPAIVAIARSLTPMWQRCLPPGERWFRSTARFWRRSNLASPSRARADGNSIVVGGVEKDEKS